MTLKIHFQQFRRPGKKRAQLMVAAEFVRREALARSECNDSDSALVLYRAVGILDAQIAETLPKRYNLSEVKL